MNIRNLLSLFCGFGFLLFSIGCETTNTNTNTNTANTNNSNQIVLTNTNNNTNSNTDEKKDVTKEDIEKDIESYKRQAKELGSKVGDSAEDMWIWVKTRSSLAAVDDLRDSTINVDVDKNIVTLRGTVANAAQKSLAEKTVREIDLVKNVVNQLKISADSSDNKSKPDSK